jgi:SAM-dependent methyltransferase
MRWLVTPSLRRAEAVREAVDVAFDRQYGVETGGIVRSRPEDVVGDNWALGGSYQAVDPAVFMQALNAVTIPHEQFTFIDFGSGKGRALLLASLLPFRRIVGVEYSKRLNQVARENVRRFPAVSRRCQLIEVVDADAAEYVIPDDPLVLFLYHPFAEPVMTKVVKNVADSYRRNPRRILVIYMIPYLAHLWEGTGFLKPIHSAPAIFDSHPAEAGPTGISRPRQGEP